MIAATATTELPSSQVDRPPAARGLATSWDTTIPRALVHKRAVSEVLLTSVEVDRSGASTVGAQWPAGNGFFRQSGGRYFGINVALETVRQASVALTHVSLGVSPDDQFVMLELAAEVNPGALQIETSSRQIAVVAELAADVSVGSGRRVRWQYVLYSEADIVGTGHGELIAMKRERYADMRGGRVTSDEVSERVSREPVYGPVVSRLDDLTYELNVDPRHANYFDHPLDHVPGMLILEGPCEVARREHETLIGRPAVVFSAFARCRRFAELGQACLMRPTSSIDLRLPDRSSHLIDMTQAGVLCAQVEVGVTSVSACISD